MKIALTVRTGIIPTDATAKMNKVVCLMLLSASLLQLGEALEVGAGCPGESECVANSECTAGRCSCVADHLLVTGKCISRSDVCASDKRQLGLAQANTKAKLYCGGLSSSDTMEWYINKGGANKELVGSCPPIPGNCSLTGVVSRHGPLEVSRPPGNASHLMFTQKIKLVKGTDTVEVFSCRKSGATGSAVFWLDVYEQGSRQLSTEWETGDRGRQVLKGWANFTSVASQMGCYGCQWFEEDPATKTRRPLPSNLTNHTKEESPAGSGRYDVTCTLTQPDLPAPNRAYKYLVEGHHNRQKYPAGGVFVIENPSPPVHDCPATVAEGAYVRCSCLPSRTGGLPKRSFTWASSGSDVLELGTVHRGRNGQRFNCSEQSGVHVIFTLRIAYGPGDVHIAVSERRGDNVSVACIAPEVNPSPTFTWSYEGKVIDEGQLLEVMWDQFAPDSVLECKVTNKENKDSVMTSSVVFGTLETGFNFSHVAAASSQDSQLGAGIGVGVAVMLPLLAAALVILVLLWRKTKSSPSPADTKEDSEDTIEHTGIQFQDILNRQDEETPAEPPSGTAAMEERRLPEETPEEPPSGSSPMEERGFPEGSSRSNYAALESTRADPQDSPYDNLQGAAHPRGLQASPPGDTSPACRTESEHLYANRETVMESPIYANTQLPEQF